MMEDMLTYLQKDLEALRATGNLRTLPHADYEGRYVHKDGRRMLNCSSNDYLGLASDRGLYDEFLRTLPPAWRLPSASSSRLLTGNHPVSDALERRLAELYGKEDALTFNSGYDANTGILPALAGKDDLIVADKLVHASLIDGIRLSAAAHIRYRHNDFSHLERLLEQQAGRHRLVFIVTESLFSMDGDAAPLAQLVQLKRRHPNVVLYIDEAHALGVRGPRGLGLAEEAGCVADIDLLIGTLGKAAASSGAFLVCKGVVKEYLVNHVRPLIFTTSLPPIIVAWSLYVMDKLPDLAEKRRQLDRLATRMHAALDAMGRGLTRRSHIIPIAVGQSKDAVRLAEHLQRCGFYLLPVRPPTVPEGTARLRLSLRADMTEHEIDALAAELARALSGGGTVCEEGTPGV